MSNRHTAVLLSTGDEVITGQTVDSNASWLAERLTDLGFDVVLKLTVGDRMADLVAAMAQAATAGDVVLCTGGLGPTQDDLTAQAVAQLCGDPLALHQPSLDQIRAIYKMLGRPMAASNEKQAWLPANATVLRNQWGTAPGFAVDHSGAWLAFVPGVPREMRAFWNHHLQPTLVERFALVPERLVVLRCMGIHESKLANLMTPMQSLPGVTLGFRTKLPENQVKLRLDPSVPVEREAELIAQAREIIGAPVFGVNSGPLEQVIGELLAERGQTVATAESCTGGRISAGLTSVAGSSRYVELGVCAYSNAAKVDLVGVPAALIESHGAVSEPVARAMAQGIRERAGTTFGVGTTGIAGPGGGSPGKPVGTVHIAVATPTGTLHKRFQLRGNRERITALATGAALDMLRRHLQGHLNPS
jgi:nicotinamide-nucleotide amidase